MPAKFLWRRRGVIVRRALNLATALLLCSLLLPLSPQPRAPLLSGPSPGEAEWTPLQRRHVRIVARSRPALSWPLTGPITSGFGPRWGRWHRGIDLAAPAGTPVRAAASGQVSGVGWTEDYGRTVEINHGGGTSSFYAHLSRVLVEPGQRVERGTIVSTVGRTGRTTGPHLHFEIRLEGEPVDPLLLLPPP